LKPKFEVRKENKEVSFEREAEELKQEWLRRSEEILKKDYKFVGLDGPQSRDLKKLEIEMKNRFKELRKKYNLNLDKQPIKSSFFPEV